MSDDECVNVCGCRRYVSYSGYLDTFRCGGLLPDDAPPVVHEILTLDACTQGHFRTDRQLRDVSKAYASFAALAQYKSAAAESAGAVARSGGSAPQTLVSTGRWGCGVFGGLPSHKFTQQIIAARLAGVSLRFSTFGTPDGCDVVLDAMQTSGGASVAEAWDRLLRCERRDTFERAFCAELLRAREGRGAGERHQGGGASAARVVDV